MYSEPATDNTDRRNTSGMPPPVVECQSCGHTIDAPDKYCRYCGRAQTRPAAWYYRPIWILVLTFTVLGPLALVLVWRSPVMGRRSKCTVATVILVLTAVACCLSWQLVVAATNYWKQVSTELGRLGVL